MYVGLFFQQFLILRVATHIFAHKPAQRPDLQPILFGIIQASLYQFATQSSSTNGRWDTGVCENDDLTLQHVIEHSYMPIGCDLETMFFLVMNYFNIFVFHRFIFIPM
jgi:hypothetical protein